MNNQNIYQKTEKVELAKLRPRISAYIADVALFWFPLGILFFAYLIFLFQADDFVITRSLINQFRFKAYLIIGSIFFIYSGFLTGRYGWTLGKRYTNIAVVTAANFKKVDFLRAFLREAIKFGLIFIPYVGFLILLLNIYLIKTTTKKQAIHDMIAGTQVITIPESKKIKKILNIAVIICSIIFFVLLSGAISLALEKKMPEETIAPTEKTQQIYRNGKYLYEIEYPSDWYIIDTFADERVIYFQNVSKEEAETKMKNLQTEDLDLIAVAVEEYSIDEWKSKWTEQYKEEVKIEDITIGTEKGYKIITEQSAIIGLSKNGKICKIYQMFPSECEFLDCDIFNQMLSTFKFIE